MSQEKSTALEDEAGLIEGLKRDFPGLKVAVHTALLDEKRARNMESAGVDTVMMDVIGAQETIEQVYKLQRPVEGANRRRVGRG